MGPPDPNNDANAGVGGIARAHDTLFEYKPISKEFQKVRDAGRAIHLGFCLGRNGTLISIFNIYGHSGGAQNPRKAEATSAILEACILEAGFFMHTPKFIIGDVNGDFEDFPQLEALCCTM